MKKQQERRRWPRQILPTPEIGIVYPHRREERDHSSRDGQDTLLVYLHNMSEGGLLLESLQKLKTDTLLDVRLRPPHEEEWQIFRGTIVRSEKNPAKSNSYYLAVERGESDLPEEHPIGVADKKIKKMQPCDLEFLMNTTLLDAIPLEAKCPLLDYMTSKHVRAGERLISQGDEGDSFYLIQEGSCAVNSEKKGVIYPIARLKAGDIVGEMAILTGERRTAHVEAETDMIIWGLTRVQFDELCSVHPDLRDFLTEIVTHRFSTEKLTTHRTVGKYLLNEILGRGGWSIVYKGIHEGLNVPVAIKMLKHTMAMNTEFSEKFKNEAKTIAHLNHENIVKVYDFEELYRTTFIIMEYLEGTSLEYILEKMPRLPLPRILDILLQVCSGLAYAHERGIVHQDIKPANIFIQTNGQARILDFGLACSPGTIDFCLPGTVYYMSPEQIQGEIIDERTDIYSLGIMAYEMITGQRPYPEDNLAKLMDLHVNKDIPDPTILVPDLPKELLYFIRRATQRDPSARFKTVWEILRDLQPYADKMGINRQSDLGERRKMMSLFLFYQDGQQLILNRLVEDFSKELKTIGAVLRAADFKDV